MRTRRRCLRRVCVGKSRDSGSISKQVRAHPVYLFFFFFLTLVTLFNPRAGMTPSDHQGVNMMGMPAVTPA